LDQTGQPGLGPKPGDEIFDLFPALILIDARFFIDFLILGDLQIVLFRIAGDLSDFFPMNAQHMRDDGVHKTAIMGNQKDFPGPLP